MRKEAVARPVRPANIELQVEAREGLLGVEAEIFSAFANIIGNALKFTPAEGSVRIRWFLEGPEACLSVSDTGIGIPADSLPRLTERFYRVDKGRDRSTGGTGLGLAIVKHVLQRHDARLEIQSRLGEGSRFTCRFPASRVAPPRSAPEAA
jgi:two-component system phosphate regulon sensor histidine kinase PhoR